MRNLKSLLVAPILLMVWGCETVESQTDNSAPTPQVNVEPEQTYFLSEEDTRILFWVQTVGIERMETEIGETVWTEAFAAGAVDALNETPQLPQGQMQQILKDWQTRYAHFMRERQARETAERILASSDWIAEKQQLPGAIVTENGVVVEFITRGDGPLPTAEDTVRVHYEGTLINGEVFDSSIERGEPVSLNLSGVIAGWREGLQIVPAGSAVNLYIAPELAYGAQATSGIPSNSALAFFVEILAVE